MDPITLVATTVAIVSPYLAKSGEKFAESIGKDVWNWIKGAFSKKKGKDISPDNLKENWKDELSAILLEEIEKDDVFKKELQAIIGTAQNELKNCSQTIINEGNIDKQVNIQNNSGNIQIS